MSSNFSIRAHSYIPVLMPSDYMNCSETQTPRSFSAFSNLIIFYLGTSVFLYIFICQNLWNSESVHFTLKCACSNISILLYLSKTKLIALKMQNLRDLSQMCHPCHYIHHPSHEGCFQKTNKTGAGAPTVRDNWWGDDSEKKGVFLQITTGCHLDFEINTACYLTWNHYAVLMFQYCKTVN